MKMTREEVLEQLRSIPTKGELTVNQCLAISKAIRLIEKKRKSLTRRDEMAKSIYHSVRTGVYSMGAWGGGKGTLHEASARETVIATDKLLAELDKKERV